jgi:hypothetical protein
VPFVVFESEKVGFSEILQQTPRAVTSAPPSAVTFPEQDAVVVVMLVISPVETTGIIGASCGIQENNTKAMSGRVIVCFMIKRVFYRR